MKLAGFTISDMIYSIDETVVARAEGEDGARVVLKYQNTQRPSLDLNARWRHEHDVLQSINSERVIKSYGLRQADHIQILVLEDFSATNLAQLLAQRPLTLAERLQIATRLAQAVSDVHQHRLIHCDISAKNVLVDAQTLQLKLCDFGLSSRLDHEQKHGQHNHLCGTLEYISPEQTGRTNLEVDYRSDFYSLGVVLYELLLGAKPFQSDDPMTLLHCHLALQPTPLHEMDAGIPQALSAIVQKLLAKNPDDRYQSSYGLLADLQHCAAHWQAQHQILPFLLAQQDVPERFRIGNRLYGRETETAALLAAFERAAAGRAEMVLVGGYSGIGKSTLVNELQKPIVARRGYFISGKCDQFSRNQPYSALIQAFQPLLQQLAGEGEQRRAQWRLRLLAALGENAAAIADIFPNLSLLIGEPAPLQALPAAEMENRFHIAFGHLVDALATREQPLALFVDDLQWSDWSTLRLLEKQLLSDQPRALLIAGAYRDNEVDEHHPLTQTIAAIERAHGRLQRLQLTNLTFFHVQQLIADALRSPADQVLELATLCWEKTQGNPFFLRQFLTSLYQHGEIHYNRAEGAWDWNIEQIRRRDITANVVELMLDKLRELEPATQTLLAQAAHLGGTFDMRQLTMLTGTDATATSRSLWPALREGLVVPLNDNYKFLHTPEKLLQARYRFLHDRVQQAAHDLTPEAERLQLQLRVGRLLLAHTPAALLDEQLFVILEQLNQALPLIDDADERARLLQLNLRAGIRAKNNSACPTAVQLLRTARQLLQPDAWQTQPEQTLSLHKELAEAEYLSGNFAAAEALYPQAIDASDNVVAKITLYLVQAEQYLIQGRFQETFPVLLAALALLGESFPETDAAAGSQFAEEFANTERMLAQYSQAALLNAAEMQQPERLLQMRIYFALSFATYQTGQFRMFAVDTCKLVQTTLLYGQCDLSCIAYVAYVTAMSAAGRPYTHCHRMGRLALTLAERRDNKYFRLTTYQYFSPFYQHWGEPLPDSFPYLDKGLALAQEGINPLSGGYCALLRCVSRFAYGDSLNELQQLCEDGLTFLQQSHQPNTEAMLRFGVLHPVLALQGKTLGPLSFDTATSSAAQFFNGDYHTPSIHLALFSGAMLRHGYLLDDYDLWQRFVDNLPLIGMCLPDSPSMVDGTFYAALGQLRWLVNDDNRTEQLAQIKALREKFHTWTNGCIDNFKHKYLLLAAEIARVEGDDSRAMELYGQAIDSAKQAGFRVCEALANELYARYWIERKQKQLATSFILEAHYHYEAWGAAVKCNQMETCWPQLTFPVGKHKHTSSERTKSYKKVSSQTDLLDLQSLLKANQLLAEEIQLDALLRKMLGVLLENAGAEFGAIVLCEGDELIAEVTGRMIKGLQLGYHRLSKPLADVCGNDAPLLPDCIIEHVQRTHETLLLNLPAEDRRFSGNRYLQLQRPKSVMCLPFVAQGKLVAVVYLENNLLENAFTIKQQKTLEMLSAQAAISLINARLYDSLEEKVLQRTDELRQMTMRDGLTGIANRRSFDERLDAEWRRCVRSGQPLSLLMIDIDHFKQYNDHYGHVDGDFCIRAVAQTLAHSANRAGDFVARYGGEEFAILLADADQAEAERVAATCLAAVATLALPHARSDASSHVSISIGVCTMAESPENDGATLLKHADQALYQAKQAGRNRYVVYHPAG